MMHRPRTQTFGTERFCNRFAAVESKNKLLAYAYFSIFILLSIKRDVRCNCSDLKLVSPVLTTWWAGRFGLQPQFLQAHLPPPILAVRAVLTLSGCATGCVNQSSCRESSCRNTCARLQCVCVVGGGWMWFVCGWRASLLEILRLMTH